MGECTGDCDKKCDTHEGLLMNYVSLKSRVVTASAILSLLVGSLLTSMGFLFVSSESRADEVNTEFKKVRVEISTNSSNIGLINQSMKNMHNALLYNRKLLVAIVEESDIEVPPETSLTVLPSEGE